jgi:naringenin degradation protein FdeH
VAIELAAGDLVVQRGTDHAWENRGDEPVRILFVLVGGRFSDDLPGQIDAHNASHRA